MHKTWVNYLLWKRVKILFFYLILTKNRQGLKKGRWSLVLDWLVKIQTSGLVIKKTQRPSYLNNMFSIKSIRSNHLKYIMGGFFIQRLFQRLCLWKHSRNYDSVIMKWYHWNPSQLKINLGDGYAKSGREPSLIWRTHWEITNQLSVDFQFRFFPCLYSYSL